MEGAPTNSALDASAAWPGFDLPKDFDLDLFLVTEGLRELGKWEGRPDSTVADACARLAHTGLTSRVVPGPEPGVSVIFFARSPRTLDAAETLERAYRATRSFAERAAPSRELGLLLGYPACCVEAWAVGPQRDEPAILRLGAGLDRPAPPLLDFFPRTFAPVGFLPCELACGAALRHAERVAAALESRHGIARAALEAALRGVVLWLSGPHFVLMREVSELNAQGFTYGSVATPVDSESFVGPPSADDLTGRTRGLAATFRRGHRLVIEGSVARLQDRAGRDVATLGAELGKQFVAFVEPDRQGDG